jgi:hypothetical protein
MAEPPEHRSTRGTLLRGAVTAGAVALGGTTAWRRSRGDEAPLAAASDDMDAKILNLFLLLEDVQHAFYREAERRGRLDGDLLTFARTVGAEEREHVRFLRRRLGSHARRSPDTDFGDLLADAERFRDGAVELEEATIAAYIGQGANLRRQTLRAVAPLISVEARQAAWIRDLARANPAPRAADPARPPQDVVADLRRRGFLA